LTAPNDSRPPNGMVMWVAVPGDGIEAPPELLERARAGDRAAREDLLARYEPLILRMASKAVGRYLRKGHDDEVSVALMAFDEAVRSFDPQKGRGFSRFAEQVIRRRLVDHYRRSQHPEVSFSSLEEVDETGAAYVPALVDAAVAAYADRVTQVERRQEVEAYARRLREFGLTLEELARVCPRHQDSRRTAVAIGRLVAEDPQLREYLFTRRELPLRALAERVPVSRKTLERQRRFIVAVALLFAGDFPTLREYVRKG
jgi:RNA polymerase sigma factor